MSRLEGPAARRLRRQAARRTRWEIAIFALAVGHWAYHKNREWNLLVRDLVSSRDAQVVLDGVEDAGPSTTTPPHAIDLTSTDDELKAAADRKLLVT